MRPFLATSSLINLYYGSKKGSSVKGLHLEGRCYHGLAAIFGLTFNEVFGAMMLSDVSRQQRQRRRLVAEEAVDEDDVVSEVEVDAVDDDDLAVEQNVKVVADAEAKEEFQRLGFDQRCWIKICLTWFVDDL